jgi:hypothetical protein
MVTGKFRENVGKRVIKTMGVKRTGVIVEPFYYKDSTDGTYNVPKTTDWSVQWDDGDKGYCSIYHLDYEM